MPRDHGRVAWRPRSKTWEAIWYAGKREVRLGIYATRELASAALQGKISATRLRRRADGTFRRR